MPHSSGHVFHPKGVRGCSIQRTARAIWLSLLLARPSCRTAAPQVADHQPPQFRASTGAPAPGYRVEDRAGGSSRSTASSNAPRRVADQHASRRRARTCARAVRPGLQQQFGTLAGSSTSPKPSAGLAGARIEKLPAHRQVERSHQMAARCYIHRPAPQQPLAAPAPAPSLSRTSTAPRPKHRPTITPAIGVLSAPPARGGQSTGELERCSGPWCGSIPATPSLSSATQGQQQLSL